MKENSAILTIRACDFNLVANFPELLKQLRKLTLDPYSGMNHELTNLCAITKERAVKAEVLLAYHQNAPGEEATLVGWTLMSLEHSASTFYTTNRYFRPGDGMLVEIFVHPSYRRLGIGSELMKVAKRKAGPYRLCVAPWDARSRGFYNKFANYRAKWL